LLVVLEVLTYGSQRVSTVEFWMIISFNCNYIQIFYASPRVIPYVIRRGNKIRGVQ
jgi:hypothetical protein